MFQTRIGGHDEGNLLLSMISCLVRLLLQPSSPAQLQLQYVAGLACVTRQIPAVAGTMMRQIPAVTTGECSGSAGRVLPSG